ncbi:MAG: V-type ATP synthase subunit E [Sedimentisphaerales bacterium]|nr:V-type ATP synthase subunit E [Sedimentisphaerales bacterium]
MDKNQVVQKILDQAQGQADEIKKQADEKIRQETENFQKQLDAFNEETKQLTEQAAQKSESQTIAQARMKIAKESLRVRNELLDETFAAAAENIKNMKTEDYQQLMEKLILKAAQSGDAELIIDKNEKRIDAAFVERLNSRLAQNNKGKLTLSQSRADIGAGFILQKDKIRINASLNVLLATAKEELQTELANELFSK